MGQTTLGHTGHPGQPLACVVGTGVAPLGHSGSAQESMGHGQVGQVGQPVLSVDETGLEPSGHLTALHAIEQRLVTTAAIASW
jgi:hypothetical protein